MQQRYLYVESIRGGKTVRHRLIAALGRKDALVASDLTDWRPQLRAMANACPTLTRGGLPLAALAVHAEGLALHDFYRAMAWLGEELGEGARRAGGALRERRDRGKALRTPAGPVHRPQPCVHGHNLVVLPWRGRQTLGKRGHSKDFRPDLAQMILALVVDAEGRPICTEMVLGNAADVTVLLPVVDRLRTHFSVPRACVAAVFARLPAYPAHRIDDLLPWNRRSAKLRTQPAAA